MQTFLPLPDYLESMRCLDKSRLGNQVWREGITLIRGGWPNHPASKMWRGHEFHLGLYLLAGHQALTERGKQYPIVKLRIMIEMAKFENTGPPPWLGDEEFHLSHRSNLLRKDLKYYRQFWPNDPDNLPYIWPTNKKAASVLSLTAFPIPN
jgi:hypothetical protein